MSTPQQPYGQQPDYGQQPYGQQAGYGQQAANGQLALWLGTSSGALLLVALQMPDTEDNRILQLQSITAEPLRKFSHFWHAPHFCIDLEVFRDTLAHSHI
jgi:hypothetical protein